MLKPLHLSICFSTLAVPLVAGVAFADPVNRNLESAIAPGSRNNNLICYMEMPNQRILDLQKLCGGTQTSKSGATQQQNASPAGSIPLSSVEQSDIQEQDYANLMSTGKMWDMSRRNRSSSQPSR